MKKAVTKSFKTQPVTPSNPSSSVENAQPKSIDDPITQTSISEELPQNLKEPANPSNEAAAVVDDISAPALLEDTCTLFHNRTMSDDEMNKLLDILSKGWKPNKKPASVENFTATSPEILEACKEWIGFGLDWSSLVYTEARKPGELSLLKMDKTSNHKD